MPRNHTLWLVVALLAAACARHEPVVIEPAGPYWAPIDDFFDGAVGWETVSEHPDEPVRMRVLSALPFLEPGGYDLPFLSMAPPAEVRLAPATELGPLRFEALTGAIDGVGRDVPCTVRFDVLVDGSPALSVERTWSPELGPDARQWGTLEAVAIPAGADVRLRTALVDGPADVALEVGFGRPRVLREEARPEPAPGAPNIVFVLMDTLRRDKLSVYGGDEDRTPHLARLAERGVVFDDAYATASWTWPSTASLLTGLLPDEHGIVSHDESYLHGRARTLPEVLRAAGYVTGGFSTNPLIDICHNYDQGFDTYRDPTWLFDPTGAVAGDVVEWLRAHAHRRFFLYLHLVDPHVPYEPLPRFADAGPKPKVLERPRLPMELREHLIERMAEVEERGEAYVATAHVNPNVVGALERQYERCVQSADHWVGEFVRELDALGLSDDTVFVFTSDHGEEFLEHGLLAHASSLHRELTNVPLIVAGPGWERGRRVDGPISNRHLAPTLARLARADASQLGGPDAVDLRTLSEPDGRPVFFSTTTGIWKGEKGVSVHGMRAADWLVHVWAPPTEGAPRWETQVFDLAQDPAAQADVAGRDPDRTEALRDIVLERLERSRERRAAEGDVEAVGAGEAGLQLLKSIGYIGDDE